MSEAEVHEEQRPRRARLRDFLPYLRGQSWWLAIAVFSSLVATGLAIGQPLVVQALIGTASPRSGFSIALVSLLIGVTIAEAVFSALRSYMLQRTGEAAVLGVRRSLLGRLLRLPIQEYDKRELGDLLSRAGSDSSMLRSLVTSGVFDLAAAAIMFVASILLMASLDLSLLIVVLVTVLVGTGSVLAVSALMRSASRDVQDRIGDVSAAAHRALSAVRTIRASRATDREVDRVMVAAQGAYMAGLRIARLDAIVRTIVSLFIQGSIVLVLAVGGVRVALGAMTLATLVAFVLYLSLLIQPISQGLGAASQMQSALGALERIHEIVRISSEGDTDLIDPFPTIEAGADAVRFEEVRFGYAPDQPILAGVSFSLTPGSRNAIVGPSGAGKSTILSLLERFYEVDAGRILINGQDITSMTRADLRAHFAYVEQDAPAVSGTIADNLRLGNHLATDNQMRGALGQVGLEGLLARSPEDLLARVGDDGILLSGGERQRLAWARALLSDADVLLLDEPTSAVDARTEDVLRDLLVRAAHDKTVLVIAHRLATVVQSDQIIVLQDGQAAAIGTHSVLLETSDTYRDFASRQLLVS